MAVARLIVALLAVSCTSQPLFGPPTDATCPPDTTLTYDSFGRPFMEHYCTRCHSSTLAPGQRMGAPTFHDFDTRSGVRVVADHIDETTAAGPTATNTSMPPNGDRPTIEERRQLGEWLACGVP